MAGEIARVNTLPTMKPSDFTLPERFIEYRPGQLKAIEAIKNTKAKYILLQAPTGAGKTLIGATIQRLFNQKLLYVVRTIQLEEQLKADFPYASVLKGRSNYPTANNPKAFPTINASMCTKRRSKHCKWCCSCEENERRVDDCPTSSANCAYMNAKIRALKSPLSILNIALFLTEANFVGGFSGWPWVVIDEADTLESSLLSFVEFTLPSRLAKSLGINPPEKKTKEASWLEWARKEVRPKLDQKLEAMKSDWTTSSILEENRLISLIKSLDFFIQDIQQNPWVYDPSNSEFSFKPVFVSRYAQNTVWKHGTRFILMSGTLISFDQTCRDLGIPKAEAKWIDLESEFDPRRRPIFYSPTTSMSNKTKGTAWGVAVNGLDKSLDKYKGKKVLVHTVSTALAQYVYENSKHRKNMIVYGNGVRRETALTSFKKAVGGKVLVAQSMERGVDLPDDLCRVIIVLKVPFPNLGDKQVSKRVYSDRKGGNTWYTVCTWRTLIQMTGRGMRSARDYCVVEIHDAQFGDNLWAKSKHLAPKWWRDAVKMEGHK